MAPAFSAAASMYLDEDKTLEVFRSGAGMPWGEHNHRLFDAGRAVCQPGPANNVGPIARIYYSASTTMCTPNALSQGTLALGAQAGPERLTASLAEAGFGRVRMVHENPFNSVFEARV